MAAMVCCESSGAGRKCYGVADTGGVIRRLKAGGSKEIAHGRRVDLNQTETELAALRLTRLLDRTYEVIADWRLRQRCCEGACALVGQSEAQLWPVFRGVGDQTCCCWGRGVPRRNPVLAL